MDISVSGHTEKIKYAVRNIARRAKELEKQGKRILYLNIGDPAKYDFKVPGHIVNAHCEAICADKNYYGFSSGVDEAREAIAKDCRKKGFKNLSLENIIITTGISEGIDILLNVLLNPGDNILAPSPNYPLYDIVANKIGAQVVPYYLDEENEWQPDIRDMKRKINDRTKAILVINPNNPTGAVYKKETLQQIIELAAERKVPIISDEIYDKLLFDEEIHIPLASMTDEIPVITFNGLSKNYLAPGWRIGWIIESNINPRSQFAATMSNMVDARLSSPTPAQFAIKAALEGSQDNLASTISKMQERRNIAYERLNKLNGISCVKPKGAFYAFPRINSDKYGTDEEFALGLLQNEGVVVVHGSGFGQKPGTKHFRLVFLPKPDILHEAFDRIERFVA
ncbi:aminotransferase class I/II-fold pyridoxal phosphate-dependent enzyme [Candidatus Woesearchaeota archaeon]|nr:aminotransferase class I/II-fold pyridoxal phosphate-dependent enzyme [Candidatus Woesearchaeota archaeon]